MNNRETALAHLSGVIEGMAETNETVSTTELVDAYNSILDENENGVDSVVLSIEMDGE